MQSSDSSKAHLPRLIADRVIEHALATPADEVCGLIGVGPDGSMSLYPAPNRAREPSIRFSMDAQTQINAFRSMRESGETLFAIYHSHPATPATPSARDIAEAAYPDALYLIVSLAGQTPDLRAYRLRDGKVETVEIAVQ